MKRIGPLLVEFATWHRDAKNRACHYLGIPAVTLPVLGLLARVELPHGFDLALALLAFTVLFDLVFAPKLAPGVLALGLALWAAARPLPLWALGLSFAVGWIFQIVGHRVFEKNAPAFTDNLVHLIVGPRWLVNRLFRVYPET